jgi:septum formation inhibitor MinC
MALEKQDFKEIEDYLIENIHKILSRQSLSQPSIVYEIELLERMVRVEGELKNKRELMKDQFKLTEKMFEQIDKRFEQVDKRFEQVDKRFEQTDKRFEDVNSKFKMMFAFISLGFTTLAVMMTLFKFLV